MMKQTPKKVQKQWGYELWLANNEENNYCGKILHVNSGHKFSMHFHSDKHETFYILNGECRLRTVNTETTIQEVTELKQGDCYVIERLVPHQIEAITDCDIIESSTFHRDEDSYRVWRD
jgi:mannose-6-phosphate isomerase|tara:strand:+ start:255 stop:611 length:357 start_codon:yes stop_codon:yes gene_type:complete